MGNFQNIFRQLRIASGLTQNEMAEKIGISRSTIGMYETGAREPDFETLEKIADFFNVDTDYLLGRSKKILDMTRAQLENQEGLMFDGDPASPEAIESIISAMQIGMELAKKKNKEKYTPKKYKKD